MLCQDATDNIFVDFNPKGLCNLFYFRQPKRGLRRFIVNPSKALRFPEAHRRRYLQRTKAR